MKRNRKHMISSSLSILLVISMMIGMLVLPIHADPAVWDGSVADSFAGGNGTEVSPYLISNAAEFAYFSKQVNENPGTYANKYYKLTADIVMNKAISFTPIAAGVGAWSSFKGDFDGAGYTISKVFVDTTSTKGTSNEVWTTGLFGCVGPTATIHDFLLSDSSFTGINPVGGVAGMATLGASFYNIYVDSNVTVENALADGAGGIIGQLTSGKDSNEGTKVTVDSCVNAGNITVSTSGTSGNNAGGIIGNGNGKMISVTNCLNMGSITAAYRYASGIVGREDLADAVISYCVNVGSVSCENTPGTYAKQITNSNSSTKKPLLTKCYALNTSYGRNTTNSLCAQTDVDSLSQTALLGNLPADKWTVRTSITWDGDMRTTKKAICVPTGVASFAPVNYDIKTEEITSAPSWLEDYDTQSSFTIDSKDKFVQFIRFVNGGYDTTGTFYNKTVNLTVDVDLNPGFVATADGMTGGSGVAVEYNSIGNCGTWQDGFYFAGTFNGGGHTISGLYMTQQGNGGGLFGSVAGSATITNFRLANSCVNISSNGGAVGGIAGLVERGANFSKIYVDSTVFVYGGGDSVGAIVGQMTSDKTTYSGALTTVENCVSAATVDAGGKYVGGILGNGNGKTVTLSNCLMIGSVSGTSYVGGIFGYNTGTMTVANCIYVGTGYGDYPIGDSNKSVDLTVTNCYSTAGTNNQYRMGVDDGSGTIVATKFKDNVNKVEMSDLIGQDAVAITGWTKRGTSNTGNGVVSGWKDVLIPSQIESFAPVSGYRIDYKAFVDSTLFVGNGDKYKPYEITNQDDLERLAEKTKSNDLSGMYFKLTQNITVNTGAFASWNLENIIKLNPIGSEANPFVANFNGNGKTISGLYMNQNVGGAGCGGGLFGVLGNGAEVYNLKIANSRFEDTEWVGAIAGEVKTAKVYDVYIAEDVLVKATAGGCAGGIIGGIVGDGSIFVISGSVFEGTVTATGDCVGGIIGNGNAKMLTVSNCLNMGSISGGNYVCGIVGRDDYTGAVVEYSINMGELTATGSNKYAIIASSKSTLKPIVRYNYYKETTGLTVGNNVTNTDSTSKTYEELCGNALVGNLSADLWVIRGSVENANGITVRRYDICIPKNVNTFAPAQTKCYSSYAELTTSPFDGGDGTAQNPYLISSKETWTKFSDAARAMTFEGLYIELTADITVNPGNAKDWLTNSQGLVQSYPIGNQEIPFRGHFNGDGHTISGFYIIKNGVSADGVAVFGFVGEGAFIENLKVSNSLFKDSNWVGGLVSQVCGSATIQNIVLDQAVIVQTTGGGNANAGGVVAGCIGAEYTLNINNCVFSGTVKTNGNYVAGILGNANSITKDNKLHHVTISACMNTGRISGNSIVAGIATASELLTVSNCVNVGTITANTEKYADIFAGEVGEATLNDETTLQKALTVSNCYYIGKRGVSNNSSIVSDNYSVSDVVKIPYMSLFGSNAVTVTGFTRRANDLTVPAGVNAFVGQLFNFRLENGASVRIDSPTGIRFTANIAKEYYENQKGTIEEIGIIIAPYAYVKQAGDFTLSALDTLGTSLGKTTYVKVLATAATNHTDYYTFTGVLTNVKEANYEVNFAAIIYILDSNGNYTYSEFDESVNSRSIAGVARMACEDVSETSGNGYSNKITLSVTKVKEDTIFYVGQGTYSPDGSNTGYLYRPYTATQINTLKAFYAKEVRILQQNLLNNYDTNKYPHEDLYKAADHTVAERAMRFIKEVEKYQPDIICLQEDSREWYCIVTNTLKSVYTFVGDEWSDSSSAQRDCIAFKTDRFTKVGYAGNFWLTNTPNESSKLSITYQGDTYTSNHSRKCTWVKLTDNATGKTFVMANTHLDHNGSIPSEVANEIRRQEAMIIRTQLTAIAGDLPVFLTGDFNSSVGSPASAELVTAGEATLTNNAWAGKGFFEFSSQHTEESLLDSNYFTHHNFDNKKYSRLDYCFYKTGTAIVKRYHILQETFNGTKSNPGYVSDHYGIVNDFILN